MNRTATAAAIAGLGGLVVGAFLAFRQMSTIIVGTVDTYQATTRIAERNAPTRARAKPQRPTGRPRIDPQTEQRARCLCAQRNSKGGGRVPCPVHGPSVFDEIVTGEVPEL